MKEKTWSDEELREVQTARKEIYKGRIVHLTVDEVRLPGGGTSTREVIWHRGAVCVIPVTDEGEAVLVEQFRYPYGEVLLEIPAGKLEEGDTDRLAAAKRELAEETGYRAENWVDFGEFYGSAAILSERISLFLATGLTPGETNPDEDEFLRVRKIPLSELVNQILAGKVPDGKTQAAVLRAKLYLEQTKGEKDYGK